MNKNLEELLKIGNGKNIDAKRGRKHSHPSGWAPGITLGQKDGSIITEPMLQAPSDWESILDELLPEGIDRSGFAIDTKSPVEVRRWDAGDGEGGKQAMYYFKAKIVRKNNTEESDNLEDLIKAIKKTKVEKPKPTEEERVYWVQITDLQVGQADGDGVAGMVGRALQISNLVKEDIKMLKKAGKPVSQIFVPMTGDLVEGISGWYEMQTFSVELDRRDQVKVARRLVTEILSDIASLGIPVHVAVVPGNHGENRQNGKAYTTLGDNDDIALVEQVAEAFAFSEKFEHVTFSFPSKERLSLTIEILGWIIGLTHGHLSRYGTSIEQKYTNWFKNMAAIKDPIGDADVIFSGHYHNTRYYESLIGDLAWIQGGALCDKSAWFSQTAGLVSSPSIMKGTITRNNKIEMLLPFAWRKENE